MYAIGRSARRRLRTSKRYESTERRDIHTTVEQSGASSSYVPGGVGASVIGRGEPIGDAFGDELLLRRR